MFENIELWRLIYYFIVYIITIPIIVLAGFLGEICGKKKIAALIFITTVGLWMTAYYIVFGSPGFDSFAKAMALSAFLGTSLFIGLGIFYLWKGITKRGKGKPNKD